MQTHNWAVFLAQMLCLHGRSRIQKQMSTTTLKNIYVLVTTALSHKKMFGWIVEMIIDAHLPHSLQDTVEETAIN